MILTSVSKNKCTQESSKVAGWPYLSRHMQHLSSKQPCDQHFTLRLLGWSALGWHNTVVCSWHFKALCHGGPVINSRQRLTCGPCSTYSFTLSESHPNGDVTLGGEIGHCLSTSCLTFSCPGWVLPASLFLFWNVFIEIIYCNLLTSHREC